MANKKLNGTGNKVLQAQPTTKTVRQGLESRESTFKRKIELLETDADKNELLSVKESMNLVDTLKKLVNQGDGTTAKNKTQIIISPKRNFVSNQQFSIVDSGDKQKEFKRKTPEITTTEQVFPEISSNQYTAYNEKQGIDRLQPEILLLMNFLPLFDDDDYETSAGKYFAAQSYMRNLKMQTLLSTLQVYNTVNSSLRETAQSKFLTAIDELWNHIEFLYKMQENFGKMKMTLNVARLTDDIDIEYVALAHKNSLLYVQIDQEVTQAGVSSAQGASTGVSSSPSNPSNTSNSSLITQVVGTQFDSSNLSDASKNGLQEVSIGSQQIKAYEMLPSFQFFSTKRSFSDLLQYYRYVRSDTSKFHATKIWNQTLLMIRNILTAGTTHLRDVHNLGSYLSDKNQTRVVGTIEYDRIRERVKNLQSNYNSIDQLLDVMAQSQTDLINVAIPSMENLFIELQENERLQFGTTPEKISDYITYLSREFRYGFIRDEYTSHGLNDVFGAIPQSGQTGIGNQSVFDVIFGVKLGDVYMTSASDVGKSSPKGSLSGLSYSIPALGTLVATFEDSYVKTNLNGTFTPGFEYYIESIFDTIENGEFRVDRLNVLKDAINEIYTGITSFTNMANLLCLYDPVRDKTPLGISNPEMFVENMMSEILDPTTGRVLGKYLSDPWVPFFSYAISDPYVQSALFLSVLILTTDKVKQVKRAYTHRMLNLIIQKIIDDHPENIGGEFVGTKATASNDPTIPHGNGHTFKYQVEPNWYTREGMDETSPFMSLVMSMMTSYIESASDVRIVDEVIAGRGTVKKVGERTTANTRWSEISDIIQASLIFKMMCHVSDQFIESKIKGKLTDRQRNEDGNVNLVDQVIAVYEDKTFRTAQSDLIEHVRKDVSTNRECTLTLLGTLSKMNNAFTGGVSHIVNKENLARAQALFEVVDDRELFDMLLDPAQLRLLSIDAHELKRKATASVEEEKLNSILDLNPASPTLLRCMRAVFKSDEYRQRKGYNKKILTVGIPNGMASSLESTKTIEVGSEDVDHENDIVRVKVYKTDLQYPDIIFEPKEFLFELSRFSIEDDTLISSITNESTFYDVMRSVPTRDINSYTEAVNIVPEFGRDLPSSGMISVLSNELRLNINSRTPFMGEKYSFLSNEQKNELIRNHVMSFMLTTYISILTGMDVDERRFVFNDHDVSWIGSNMLDFGVKNEMLNSFVKIANEKIQTSTANGSTISSQSPGSFFTSVNEANMKAKWKIDPSDFEMNAYDSQTLKSKINFSGIDASTLISNIDAQNVEADEEASDYIIESMKNVQDLDSLVSLYVSRISLLKRFLYPRKFERVFNIPIDPDDFMINEAATIETDGGREALRQLSNLGIVVDNTSLSSNFSVLYSSMINLANPKKLKAPEKREGDFSFEKYFVVIEPLRDE